MQVSIRHFASSAVLAATALWHHDAAAFVCAYDVASLKSALAKNPQTPLTIRIQEGSYAIGSYSPSPMPR
jgi:hypothetical protein